MSNMKKPRPWSPKLQLRRWQRKAFRTLLMTLKRDMLVVACPGSGKTTLALKMAHELLKDGLIERIVIVCPTQHLRRQWAAAAAFAGIDLDFCWANSDGVEAPDYFGVCVTYQQVSYAPDLYRLNCERRTLVIFDEVHHASDELNWGGKIREAFEHATFRISLSGTPFRSDGHPIPFINYEEGRCRPDFNYTYGEALRDGICRPIYFPRIEGKIHWLSGDGAEEESSMLDMTIRYKAIERLRAALCPRGEWLRGILRAADSKLSEIRGEGHERAAGLVVAIDQEHAKQVANILHIVSGEEPILAISEDPEASEKIQRFAKFPYRWIVAVKMVSEGVDLPNLRVGVYATVIQSEIYFKQVVGRFVRMVGGLEEQSACLYIPADETLTQYAQQILQECDHELKQWSERSANERPTNVISNGRPEGGLFTPLSSEFMPHDVVYDGGNYDAAELANAGRVAHTLGLRLPEAQVAAILRAGAALNGDFIVFPKLQSMPTAYPMLDACPSEQAPLSDRKQSLRKVIQRLASRLANKMGVEVRDVHRQWTTISNKRSSDATEEELIKKKDWLIDRINEGRGFSSSSNAI